MKFDNEYQEQKYFLTQLLQVESMAFTEAMELLSLTMEKGPSYLWSCLLNLNCGDTLFTIREKQSGEYVDDVKIVMKAPENVHLVVEHEWEEGELEMSSQYNWVSDPNNRQPVEDNQVYKGVIRHDFFRVVGDEDLGLQVREQLIHFAEWLGVHLMKLEFDVFKSRIIENRSCSASQFKEDYQALDKKMGGFESFSVNRVGDVYSPEGGEQNVDDEMPVPKGFGRDQRRGSVCIHLRSLLTPNGVPFFNTELHLNVIKDTDQLLKIVSYKFVEV